VQRRLGSGTFPRGEQKNGSPWRLLHQNQTSRELVFNRRIYRQVKNVTPSSLDTRLYPERYRRSLFNIIPLTCHLTETGHRIITFSTSNVRFSTIGRKIGLDRCLNVSHAQNFVSDSQVADAVEAVIGAVFIDGGSDSLPGVMKKLGIIYSTGRKWGRTRKFLAKWFGFKI